MKRSQDVFFFTLIDLLLQLLFVAVVVWVVDRATPDPCEDNKCIEQKPWKDLVDRNKFSTLTELLDFLTRLSPIRSLDSARKVVDEAGGVDSVRIKARMLDSLLNGVGLPPCRSLTEKGRRRVLEEGRLIAWDDSITVVALRDSLRMIVDPGSQAVGRSFSVAEFPIRFAAARSSTCRHYLEVSERTRFIYARDAIEKVFGRIRVQ